VHALVVYESMFGNTKRVAGAIADGLAGHVTVETIEVSDAPTHVPQGIDLLVVGGPTHVHGMTTVRTRADAALRTPEPLISRGIGIREYLQLVRPAVRSLPAVAFDTRINGPVLFTGSAASGFARRLRTVGFRLLQPPRSFLIATKADVSDALLEGELEKARAWGSALGANVVAEAAGLAGATR
jgi:hypothetical protein